MEPGIARPWTVAHYALAGLQTGVLAVLGMLGWLGVSSLWYRRSFWSAPNLLASSFYGEAALRNRFTGRTFSGLALFLLIYGALGIVFGLIVRQRRGKLLAAIGIGEGIVFYYLFFGWLLKHWNPLIALYLHDRPMLFGNLLYGAMLGWYARNLRQLREESRRAAVPQAALPAAGSEHRQRFEEN